MPPSGLQAPRIRTYVGHSLLAWWRRSPLRRLAHFPFQKTLAFDFSFQPSIDRKQIQELANLRFLAHGENVIFLGPPGSEKRTVRIIPPVAVGMTPCEPLHHRPTEHSGLVRIVGTRVHAREASP